MIISKEKFIEMIRSDQSILEIKVDKGIGPTFEFQVIRQCESNGNIKSITVYDASGNEISRS